MFKKLQCLGLVSEPPPETEPDTDKSKKKTDKKVEKKPKRSSKEKQDEPEPLPAPILLEEGIKKFFEKHHAGILVIGRFMVALWRDSGVFFMFDPRPRNEEGSFFDPKRLFFIPIGILPDVVVVGDNMAAMCWI